MGRRIGYGAAITVCALAPWLVPWPWQNAGDEPTDNPSAIIELSHSRAVTGHVETRQALPVPDGAAVTVLARDLAATARDGYDLPVSAAAVASVRTTPGPYLRLGRIQVPRIGLNVTFGEGVFAKTLEKGPGHWPGTPMPGDDGNSVISGHRNTHTQPFKYLNLLRKGDKVITQVGSDHKVTYRVQNTTIVPEAKFKDFVLRQPASPTAREITLFACHPEGNPIFRIVVRATADAG